MCNGCALVGYESINDLYRLLYKIGANRKQKYGDL